MRNQKNELATGVAVISLVGLLLIVGMIATCGWMTLLVIAPGPVKVLLLLVPLPILWLFCHGMAIGYSTPPIPVHEVKPWDPSDLGL